MKEKDTGYSFDSTNIFSYIRRRRIPLFIITVTGVIVSIIVSLFIEDKFKSTVVLFPASPGSVSEHLLSEKTSQDDFLAFGEEEDVEQMLQVCFSDEIRNKIIERYDLMNHYDIDKNQRYYRTKLYEEYKKNVKFIRTEYMSIEIQVLDKDSVMASNIANDIANLLDSTLNRMRKERAYRAFKIVEQEYLTLKREIQELEDSLSYLRKLGINDYESQAEVFNDAYAKALAKGNQSQIKRLEEKLQLLAKYGGIYVSIRDFLEHEKKQLSHIKAKYHEAKVDAEQDVPHKYVVSHAEPSEKKAYPIRWLIVVVAGLSTFIFALIILIIIDNFLKKK